MTAIVLYCRPGFEKECAAEIQEKAAWNDDTYRLGHIGCICVQLGGGFWVGRQGLLLGIGQFDRHHASWSLDGNEVRDECIKFLAGIS